MALAVPLVAQSDDSRWRLSGFGTLGLACSTNERGEYRRDVSQPKGITNSLDPRLDSRVGVQLDLYLTEELSFVGQTVSKYRYDHTFAPELAWAFLSYTPTSGLQIRGGRLGWDVFHLADTRNVGYSYLWVRPPVEFYGTLPFSNLDGADLTWNRVLGGGKSIRFKVSAGRASEKLPFGTDYKPLDMSGTTLLGTMTEFQGEHLGFRMAFALAQPSEDFQSPVPEIRSALETFGSQLSDPGLIREADRLRLDDKRLKYYSAGLNYYHGRFRAEAVGAQVRTECSLIPNFKAGYVSLAYRIGQVMPYTMVSRIDTEDSDPYVGALPYLGSPGSDLASAVTGLVTASQTDQKTFSLGLRWDFHPKAAFKAQVDRTIADAQGSLLWAKRQGGWTGKSTVSSVSLDFVF